MKISDNLGFACRVYDQLLPEWYHDTLCYDTILVKVEGSFKPSFNEILESVVLTHHHAYY